MVEYDNILCNPYTTVPCDYFQLCFRQFLPYTCKIQGAASLHTVHTEVECICISKYSSTRIAVVDCPTSNALLCTCVTCIVHVHSFLHTLHVHVYLQTCTYILCMMGSVSQLVHSPTQVSLHMTFSLCQFTNHTHSLIPRPFLREGRGPDIHFCA